MDSKTIQKLISLSRDSYNKIAIDFDKTRKKHLWPELEDFSREIKKGARVLDAGCGNGRLLEAFKDKQIDYLGLDSSSTLLELARRNYPQHNFLEMDLLATTANRESADFKNGFDLIFCLAVLQHIPSFELRVQVLKKLKSWLVPGGRLIISNWNLWQSTKRVLIYRQIFKKVIGLNKLDWGDLIFPWKNSLGQKLSLRYYHAFSSRELRRLAQRAGFSNIIIKKDQHNYWLILE